MEEGVAIYKLLTMAKIIQPTYHRSHYFQLTLIMVLIVISQSGETTKKTDPNF